MPQSRVNSQFFKFRLTYVRLNMLNIIDLIVLSLAGFRVNDQFNHISIGSSSPLAI